MTHKQYKKIFFKTLESMKEEIEKRHFSKYGINWKEKELKELTKDECHERGNLEGLTLALWFKDSAIIGNWKNENNKQI